MEWSFQETLIMILIAALFFKEQAAAWFSKKFGLKNGNEEKTPTWAKQLKEHYNDETTELLKKLVDRSEGQCKKLDTLIAGQKEAKEDDSEWRRECREAMRDIIRKV